MYDERWEIEVVMHYYKEACEFDETRVHNDCSVIGSEFCNFLSTVLTFRLIKAFDGKGLLKQKNYSRLMAILRRAKKARVDGGEWNLIRVNPSVQEMLAKLELMPSECPRNGGAESSGGTV